MANICTNPTCSTPYCTGCEPYTKEFTDGVRDLNNIMRGPRGLITDLWAFIENTAAGSEQACPGASERFFALRERVRTFYATDKPGAALGALRKTRKGWPKGTPRKLTTNRLKIIAEGYRQMPNGGAILQALDNGDVSNGIAVVAGYVNKRAAVCDLESAGFQSDDNTNWKLKGGAK